MSWPQYPSGQEIHVGDKVAITCGLLQGKAATVEGVYAAEDRITVRAGAVKSTLDAKDLEKMR